MIVISKRDNQLNLQKMPQEILISLPWQTMKADNVVKLLDLGLLEFICFGKFYKFGYINDI